MTAACTPDDPFGDGADRTVIRPNPGAGRPATPQPGVAQAQWPAAPASDPSPRPSTPLGSVIGQRRLSRPEDSVDLRGGSTNPVLAAATPLLALVVHLRHLTDPGDLRALRERIQAELTAVVTAGRGANVPNEPLRAAHYALCATIDDVVMSTPWGSREWGRQSMVAAFHRDVEGGERFFLHLDAALAAPAVHRVALETMNVCLALGFQGKYRLHARGPAELSTIRQNLYQTLEILMGAGERELSPSWQGVQASFSKPPTTMWLWATTAIAALVAFATFSAYAISLTSRAESVDRLSASLMPRAAIREIKIPTLKPPDPPEDPIPPRRPLPPPELPLERVRRFLAPEIDAKLVSVIARDRNVRVIVNFPDMFGSGDARVGAKLASVLTRIGEAMRREPGAVVVTGHTDSVPIATLRFPSNMALSEERARNSMRVLQAAIGDPARVSARGQAAMEPIDDNKTAEGRALNRRIEAMLVPP